MPSFRWLDDKSKYSGASASATYNTSTPASKAFDGLAVSSNTEGWRTLSNVNSAWIQVKIDEPRIITKLKIDVNANTLTGKEPKSFNFLGSNDGSTFENLATFENQTWATKIKEFDVNPDLKSYLYYRLQVLSTIDDGGIFIKEITFGEAIPSNNFLFLHDGVYKKYNFGTGTWDIVTTSSPNYSDYNQGNTLEELANLDESHWSSLDSNYDFEVLYYTENDIEDCRFELEVEPFSVYDYISENPQAIIYTESTDDIIVSIETEPQCLYDELGDEFEVLLYTDDNDITEANLNITANWSPIDELEGDVEAVTWTDGDESLILDMNATPKRQETMLLEPIKFNVIDSLEVDYKEVGCAKLFISIRGSSSASWNRFHASEINLITKEQLATILGSKELHMKLEFILDHPEDDIVFNNKIKVNSTEYILAPSIESYVANLLSSEEVTPRIFISIDGEITWKEIKQNELNEVYDYSNNEFSIKVIMENGQELHAISYSWA